MLCVCNNNILVDEQALQETSQHWWTHFNYLEHWDDCM